MHFIYLFVYLFSTEDHRKVKKTFLGFLYDCALKDGCKYTMKKTNLEWIKKYEINHHAQLSTCNNIATTQLWTGQEGCLL